MESKVFSLVLRPVIDLQLCACVLSLACFFPALQGAGSPGLCFIAHSFSANLLPILFRLNLSQLEIFQVVGSSTAEGVLSRIQPRSIWFLTSPITYPFQTLMWSYKGEQGSKSLKAATLPLFLSFRCLCWQIVGLYSPHRPMSISWYIWTFSIAFCRRKILWRTGSDGGEVGWSCSVQRSHASEINLTLLYNWALIHFKSLLHFSAHSSLEMVCYLE